MTNKRNNRGFAHHFIIPVLAMFAVGAIGVFTLNMSSATSTKASCTKLTFGRYKNNPANGGKYLKYKSCVKSIQRKVGASADGIYGDHTKAKVKAWQSSHGINADGVVGSKTWAAMGIHPTYPVTVSTTTKYSYKKCTYAYLSKTYTVSYGTPPKIKCTTKTTTNLAVAKNAIEINQSISQKRRANVNTYNKWIEKRTGGDQAGSKVSQQSILEAFKLTKLDPR